MVAYTYDKYSFVKKSGFTYQRSGSTSKSVSVGMRILFGCSCLQFRIQTLTEAEIKNFDVASLKSIRRQWSVRRRMRDRIEKGQHQAKQR